jgi:hypothetical protein
VAAAAAAGLLCVCVRTYMYYGILGSLAGPLGRAVAAADAVVAMKNLAQPSAPPPPPAQASRQAAWCAAEG